MTDISNFGYLHRERKPSEPRPMPGGRNNRAHGDWDPSSAHKVLYFGDGRSLTVISRDAPDKIAPGHVIPLAITGFSTFPERKGAGYLYIAEILSLSWSLNHYSKGKASGY